MNRLDIFILFVVCISEVYMVFDFLSAYLNVREPFFENKKMGAAVHMAVLAVWYLVNLIGNGDWNHFLVPLVILAYAAVFYYGGFWKKIFLSVIIYFIMWGVEAVFALLLSVDNEMYKHLSEMPFVVIIIKLLTYILLLFIKQITAVSTEKMSWKLFLQYISVPISGFGIMMAVFYMNMGSADREMFKVLITLCFSLFLFGTIFIFYSFYEYAEKMNQTMEQKVLITKQQAELNYYTQALKNQEEQAEFLHDTVHYLNAVREFAGKEDCAEILKILGELDQSVGKMEVVQYSSHKIVNIILSEKKKEAKEQGIFFDVYVEPGIKVPKMPDTDLISMLGNLLDNAIRAAKTSTEEPYVKVRIFMQDLDGFFVVKIENNFSGTVRKKGEEFMTTKEEKGKHGIGIRSVREKAERYGGCLSCEAQGDVFLAVLLLSTRLAGK